mmetsp:Transcript_12302/g.23890  ORF Transcript_12302/g.23890 Transcript_12302/m.23890 type:complete len:379 (+) Transcript_12302:84-1220(+)
MLSARSASLPLTAIGLTLTFKVDAPRGWSSRWQQTKKGAPLHSMLMFVLGASYATRNTLNRVQRGLAIGRRSTGKEKLALVDGSFCLYQCFYATIDHGLQNQRGEPTGAVYGFMHQMEKLQQVLQPSHFAVMLDEKTSSSSRKRDWPTYKRNRECPPDLITQFVKAKSACRALHIPCQSHSDFEADDLIATYARDAASDDCRVSIVSADKDLTQLASPLIHIHNNLQEPLRHMDEQKLQARWGVSPNQMVDLLALVGDAVDGVPGVPGIGKVKAAALLNRYVNLDEILEAARKGTIDVRGIGPKLREQLVIHGERALEMRKIVTLQSIPDDKKKKWRKDFEVRKRDKSWLEDAENFCKNEDMSQFARRLRENQPRGDS